MTRRVALTVLLLGGAVACAAPRTSTDAAPEDAAAVEVRAARLAQNAALSRGDIATAAAWWTDSVTVTAGLGRVLQGRDAYRRAFEQDAAMRYERTPTVVRVSAGYPLAWEEGTWRGGHDLATPALGGHYAAQWVRIDGQWRIRSELFVATQCAGVACSWPVAAR